MPTTMMVYLRLFAGFTSFILNRCRSHAFRSGRSGAFDSSSMSAPTQLQQAGHDGDRDRDIAHGDQDGDDRRAALDQPGV